MPWGNKGMMGNKGQTTTTYNNLALFKDLMPHIMRKCLIIQQ